MKLTVFTTAVSIFLNIAQALIKCLVGFLSNSNALFADGLHGISDVLTNAVVLVAALYAAKPADHFYPYGRGRYESLASLVISLAMIGVSCNLLGSAITEVNMHQRSLQSWILLVSGVSFISSLVAYLWMYKQSKLLKNDLIYGNAIHQLSDALSSLVVLFSCIADVLGYQGSDAFATVVVVFLIVYSAIPTLKTSILELTDHSTETSYLALLKNKIVAMPGIEEVHHLRTRRSASRVILDAHVTVNRWLSFTESHWMAEKLTSYLKTEDEDITDVLIHMDPDVDILTNLYPRETYLKVWNDLSIPQDAMSVDCFLMHYLDNGIIIDWKMTSRYSLDEYQKWGGMIKNHTPEILNITLWSNVASIL